MKARPYVPAFEQAERAAAEEAAAAERIAAERNAAEEEAAKGDRPMSFSLGIGSSFFAVGFTSIRCWLQNTCFAAGLHGLFGYIRGLPLLRTLLKSSLSLRLRSQRMLPSRCTPQPYSEGTDQECQNLMQKTKERYPAIAPSFTADNPPPADARVLLHSCCAPCSGAMFEEMRRMGLNLTIFFYNPNIHPRKEYEIRKNENKRYCEKYRVPFVDCDYDDTSWFDRMKGLEYDPERIGVRCTACFDMRMEVTAKYAFDNGFEVITSTNTTSRWKCQSQVNGAGIKASAPYFPHVRYWVYNWQTDSFTQRKYEISVEERFYKQEYCGCSYSLRDSNVWRKQQGIPPVKIGGGTAGLGTRYFEDAIADAEEESQEVVDQFFGDANEGFGLDDRLEKVYEGRQKNKELVDFNNW